MVIYFDFIRGLKTDSAAPSGGSTVDFKVFCFLFTRCLCSDDLRKKLPSIKH